MISVVKTAVMAAALLQMGGMDAPPKPKQYVVYASEAQTVKAGKKSYVELHFSVMDGYHVNSHTPKSELLIPTNLVLKPVGGVTVGTAEYPKGQEYTFSFSPGDKLDVYAGTFAVKVPVEVGMGEHEVDGALRYQACDHAACYPPKTLPVSFVVVGK
jgi:hypothetical protein